MVEIRRSPVALSEVINGLECFRRRGCDHAHQHVRQLESVLDFLDAFGTLRSPPSAVRLNGEGATERSLPTLLVPDDESQRGMRQDACGRWCGTSSDVALVAGGPRIGILETVDLPTPRRPGKALFGNPQSSSFSPSSPSHMVVPFTPHSEIGNFPVFMKTEAFPSAVFAAHTTRPVTALFWLPNRT